MSSLNYKLVQKTIGVSFRKKALLRRAFTHSSFQRTETKRTQRSNETLEFLGDAVLELLTREHLYKKFPKLSEGDLNEIKIKFTNQNTLFDVGKDLQIGTFLLMDKGEVLTGGRARPSNIAGCLEALIGAIYLDGGLKNARAFVVKHILKRDISGLRDHKSLLNRWAMKQQYSIGYRVAKSHGPPHRKIFHVDLYINKKKVSRGSGDSKKKAQQAAAKKFIEDNPAIKP
jgi:ribonuclease-3